MAQQPRAARKSCKEALQLSPPTDQGDDTESDNEEWEYALKNYIQQQLITYLIKKKPPQDEEELLKHVHVVEVYIEKCMRGTFERHIKVQAWSKILENVKNLVKEQQQNETNRFCTGFEHIRGPT